MVRHLSSCLLVLGLAAAGCARSHGNGEPEPEPDPMPPGDASMPEPEPEPDPMPPADASVPEPEPEPVPECPPPGFANVGFAGAITTEPATAVVTGVRETDELAEVQLETTGGTALTFRAPEAHVESLSAGMDVETSMSWDSGAAASHLRFTGGQVVAIDASDLPPPSGVTIGDLTLGLGAELCSFADPECGTQREYALEASFSESDDARQIAPGESTTVATPVPEGSSYLVTHGEAVDYGCERCACVVGAHFMAVVTEHRSTLEP